MFCILIIHLLNAFLFTPGTIGGLEVELARSSAFGGKGLLDMGRPQRWESLLHTPQVSTQSSVAACHCTS